MKSQAKGNENLQSEGLQFVMMIDGISESSAKVCTKSAEEFFTFVCVLFLSFLILLLQRELILHNFCAKQSENTRLFTS
jgi:hypothetical protein